MQWPLEPFLAVSHRKGVFGHLLTDGSQELRGLRVIGFFPRGQEKKILPLC